MSENKIYAVILAAGIGSRMGADITKQKMLLNGRSVIARTVGAFCECDRIDGIVVVGRKEEAEFLNSELSPYAQKLYAVVSGGKTRFESAKIGFNSLPLGVTHIVIHDGARPLITPESIKMVVDAAVQYGAATDAVRIFDTVKMVDGNCVITSTVDRSSLIGARTPQAFSTEIYARALENAGTGEGITDDNMMAEMIGVDVHAIFTDVPNPKITTMEDLKYADFLIREREGENV